MSSPACRCYSGTGCPDASSAAEEFFTKVKTEELLDTINDAVKDYVRHRGLRYACPDVRRWGPPPGPAAYLHSGLLRVGGTGSLPRGLACYHGRDTGSTDRDEKRGRSTGGGSHLEHLQIASHLVRTSEGSGGSSSQQMLSYDDMEMPVNCERLTMEAVQVPSVVPAGRSGPSLVDSHCEELTESQSTPELAGQNTGRRAQEKMNNGEFNSDQARQLLVLLGHGHANAQHGVSRGHGSRSCHSRRPLSSQYRFSSRPFSPADEWDDSGIFTVAPRPKSVPSGKRQRERQHSLKTPSISRPSSSTLPQSSIRSFVPPSKSEVWRKTRQFSRAMNMGDRLGFWTKPTRKISGRREESASELFDIREAALASFIEALARRILPWQAQLCPKALQDFELARTKVFYAAERQRKADRKSRWEGLLLSLLWGEKRSWRSFASEQRRLLETTVSKELQRTTDWKNTEVDNLTSWTRSREALDRRCLSDLEEHEAQCAWLHKVSTLTDTIWDRSVGATEKKVDHKRQMVSPYESWLEKEAHAAARSDAFRYLGMSGARALLAEGLVKRKKAIVDTMANDAERASNDRAKESESSSERYKGIREAVWETYKTNRNVRGESTEAWSLHGWLSVGTHKLVQQTLKAQISRCMHPDEVQNVLWEARRAAELASATRAVATSQCILNAKNARNFRHARDTVIKDHQRRILKNENTRVIAEDIERECAKKKMVSNLKRSVSAWRRKADALFEEESRKILAIRQEDAERTARYRKEMSGLQEALESEVERVAKSLEEWQKEEEQWIEIEVSEAAKSFHEEQVRAYKRESLFREMMFRKRDSKDRFLKKWMKERERIESASVTKEIKETRQRLEDDRTRWVDDVVTSVSAMAKVDASSLQNPSVWETTASLSPCPTENDSNTTTSCFLPLQQEGSETSGDVVESRGIAITPENQAGTLRAIQDKKLHAIQRAKAASALEALSAGKRNARVESFALLIQRGLESRWTEFWRVEMERTWMTAEALELSSVQWARRQCEEAHAVWSTWRSRAKSYSAQQGNAYEEGTGSTPELWCRQSSGREMVQPRLDQPSVDGIASRGNADAGWRDRGIAGREALSKMTIRSLALPSKLSPAGRNSKDHYVQGNIRAFELDDNRMRALESSPSGDNKKKDQQVPSPTPGDDTSMDAHVLEEGLSYEEDKSTEIDGEGRCSQWESTESNKPVRFVGSTMSTHISTFPRYLADAVRKASFSRTLLGDPSLQVEKTSSESFTGSISHGSEDDMEFGWLVTLQTLARCNEVVGLEELGHLFGTVRGGAIVLCLAHDGLIDDDKENGGCVRAEVLLSSTTALVTSRQTARKTGGIPTGISDASISRVAKAETNLELGVFGEELCGDLAQIFEESSDTREASAVHHRTSWVRRALQKHSAVLSPQSVCALTALLSARVARLKRSCAISHGCSGDSFSFIVNIAVWQSAVSEALLTVRMASLEHVVIWANACDPAETESAVYACVSALEKSMSPPASDTEHAIRSIGITWASLNMVSGVGLSSLMLLGLTLPDYGDVLCASSEGRFRQSHDVSIATNSNNSPSVSDVSSSSISRLVRSALSVLSPRSLESISCRLATPSKTPALASLDAGDCETREPEILSDVSGHPAIGDLSRRDVVALRKDLMGLIAALDVRNTGALPISALATVLQSGRAGFALEAAQVHAVLYLAGLMKPQRRSVVESSTPACQASGETASAGEYHYLGFPPGIFSPPYSEMVDKIPGMLRLIQAAHRLRSIVAVDTTAESREVDRDGLERARAARFQREVDRCVALFANALDVVGQRVSYGRLERWSAQLESPRLENMQGLLSRSQGNASKSKTIRTLKNSRRAELRHAFTSAILERITFGSSSGATLTAAVAARTRANSQLRVAMARAIAQAREGLMATAKRLGASLAEAEEKAVWDEDARIADENSRELCVAELESWGEGLTREVKASYREKAKWVQERGEQLMAAISPLAEKMVITWEEDVRECKEALAEMENRLNTLLTDFEENPDAPRATLVSPLEKEASPSSAQKNIIAGSTLSKHHGTGVALASLGAAVKDLDAECSKHCENAAGLKERTRKRLDWVLETAAAHARHERSFVARRLHSVSIYWQEELSKREKRWKELQVSRRLSHSRERGEPEAFHEPLALTGSLRRGLSRGQNLAKAVVKRFVETAAEAPVELEAKAAAISAAEALVNAHEAVKAITAKAGCAIDDKLSGATDLIEMTKEDASTRVSTCQNAIGEWWESQQDALEGEFYKREQGMQRRITLREVDRLLRDSLIPEIEARHNSETLARKTLDLILAESMRTMEVFIAAESTAMKHLHEVVGVAHAATVRESETLGLKAKTLNQTVSWTLQRGPSYGTDNFAGF